MAWWEGEELDPSSGISHLTKAIATLVVIRDAQMVGKVEDDRPPPLPAGWIEELNKKAGDIIDSHPDFEEPVLASRDATEPKARDAGTLGPALAALAHLVGDHKITCGVYAPLTRPCDCGLGQSTS
jgi:hypothetical protein